ncbi:MAG: hypothetical protein OIF35_04230, partial [Cellvibrionaceae bacterium]|nr:hypothetical protein [Cellvibrionaceae bacterium]
MRDAAHAWVINPDGFKFGVDSARGIKGAFGKDADYEAIVFGGAAFQGGYVYGTDPEKASLVIRRALVRQGLTKAQIEAREKTVITNPAQYKDMLLQGWEAYRNAGDKMENANRLATFKAALEAGKPMAQAMYEAKDLMDYSLQGNWAVVNMLTDVVPFLN